MSSFDTGLTICPALWGSFGQRFLSQDPKGMRRHTTTSDVSAQQGMISGARAVVVALIVPSTGRRTSLSECV